MNITKDNETGSEIQNFAKQCLMQIVDSTKTIEKIIDANFVNFVEDLNKTSGKIIFCSIGKSFWLSKKISATISSLGKASFTLHAAEALHGDMGVIGQNDSVIFVSNSGESKEIFPVLQFCRENNITTFSITSSLSSTISSKCNKNIIMPKFVECLSPMNPPISASVIILIIGDLIAACLAKINNFTPLQYSKYHPNGKIGLLVTTINDYLEKQKLHNRVSYFKVKISHNTTLFEAINALEAYNVGILIITNDKNQVVGCFSDGDLKRLIKYFINSKTELSSVLSTNVFHDSLKNFITHNPTKFTSNDPIFSIVSIVKDKKISHAIIVDENDEFVDILDNKDFFQWL